MDFLKFVADISLDAQPDLPGFQARPLYVVLSVVAPLIFGMLVSQVLRVVETVLESGFRWGDR
ncbi:MAG: hypothetical protein HPY44_03240 [Armatimonadetes bacterium]|nr:hypothetical protein [Armatimonadota bacterium]